jgi:hypothetical protein
MQSTWLILGFVFGLEIFKRSHGRRLEVIGDDARTIVLRPVPSAFEAAARTNTGSTAIPVVTGIVAVNETDVKTGLTD